MDAKVVRATASGKKVAENKTAVIDYSNISKGYVMVKYKVATKVKLKAQVKCPTGITYTYNLEPKKWATFPLSEGDGKYQVTVFTNISGNSYATTVSANFQAKMNNARAPFLMANQFVDYTSSTKFNFEFWEHFVENFNLHVLCLGSPGQYLLDIGLSNSQIFCNRLLRAKLHIQRADKILECF